MPRIHDVETDTRPEVVREALCTQWPDWSDQPLVGLSTTGTDHAMYRVGRDHVARFPRTESAAASLVREVGVLPRLARVVPVPVAGVLERAERWLAGDEGPLPRRVDTAAVRRVLDEARDAADDHVPTVLTHGDLIPGNVLVRDRRLAAVVDRG